MRIYLDSIGCRLNQSEVELMAGDFLRAGHTLVDTQTAFDMAVVNTCAVTAAAAADSRARIQQLRRQQPQAGIVVTGCWSTLEPAAARALTGVGWVIPNVEKGSIPARTAGAGSTSSLPDLRARIPGKRSRTRAIIKAQDGCDNRCAYCAKVIARGPARSLPVEDVVTCVRAACDSGVKEVVLTGVQLGSYGRGLTGGADLLSLIRAILDGTDVPRLRLSSLEPWGVRPGMLDLWKDNRMCPSLHLPLQSGCDATLRRMRRPITTALFSRLVDSARSAIPGLALSTDVIVGFPGETDVDADVSQAFVQGMGPAGWHVFTYAPRPGTTAARVPDFTPTATKRLRAQRMHKSLEAATQAFRASWIGHPLRVLWQRPVRLGTGGWRLTGLSDQGLVVQSISSVPLSNLFSLVIPERLEAGMLWCPDPAPCSGCPPAANGGSEAPLGRKG